MDRTDIAILNELRNNARISNLNLAAKVNLSAPAVLERVRKLKSSGVIRCFETRFDQEKLGLGMTVFIELLSDEKIGESGVGHALIHFKEILGIYDMSGEYSYLVKAVVADSASLRDLMSRIGKIPGVISSRMTLVLDTVKDEAAPELNPVRF